MTILRSRFRKAASSTRSRTRYVRCTGVARGITRARRACAEWPPLTYELVLTIGKPARFFSAIWLRRAPPRGRHTAPMPHDHPHDVVLFGATGFAGELTAQYLARNMPREGRWALAGRDPAKLERVRGRLAETDAALADLPLLTADVNDPASVRAVAESTRVVITTVG